MDYRISKVSINDHGKEIELGPVTSEDYDTILEEIHEVQCEDKQFDKDIEQILNDNIFFFRYMKNRMKKYICTYIVPLSLVSFTIGLYQKSIILGVLGVVITGIPSGLFFMFRKQL